MSPGWTLAVLAAALLVASRAARPAQAPRWLINETASMPRGLYARIDAPPTVGALVTLRPPPAAQRYLHSLGAPSEARLLKRVAAGPGQWACADRGRLAWPRGAVAVRARDRHGRALPIWLGCRRLGPSEFVVLGDSGASFDSRYFGPVRDAQVEGVYREVWRW